MKTAKKPKPSFTSDLLKHLQRHGSITNLQAIERYGSWKCSARIADLRRAGYEIATKLVKVKTRYGKEVEVAKYILKRK